MGSEFVCLVALVEMVVGHEHPQIDVTLSIGGPAGDTPEQNDPADIVEFVLDIPTGNTDRCLELWLWDCAYRIGWFLESSSVDVYAPCVTLMMRLNEVVRFKHIHRFPGRSLNGMM
jgi:hypothetical protein